jgi:hypothetical protein
MRGDIQQSREVYYRIKTSTWLEPARKHEKGRASTRTLQIPTRLCACFNKQKQKRATQPGSKTAISQHHLQAVCPIVKELESSALQ